jgi:hypothetical protein
MFFNRKLPASRGVQSWLTLAARIFCVVCLCAAYLLSSGAAAAARQKTVSAVEMSSGDLDRDARCFTGGEQGPEAYAVLTSERDTNPYLCLLDLRAALAPRRFLRIKSALTLARMRCGARAVADIQPFHLHTIARSAQLVC